MRRVGAWGVCEGFQAASTIMMFIALNWVVYLTAIKLFGACHVCAKQDLPREKLAAHKSALACTVKGGNGWCLWREIWGENILCDLFFFFCTQCRLQEVKTHKWICCQFFFSFFFSCASMWWRRRDEWACARKFYVLSSILSDIWSAATLMDFNKGADALWNQSGWCETCWKEWRYCKNLVYFHQERSIWEHVTKDEIFCMRRKGRGGQKRQNIFQTGRRKVISFMQIRALLAQMEACSCRAIMNHSSCQEMLARSYGAPDLTSLSA